MEWDPEGGWGIRSMGFRRSLLAGLLEQTKKNGQTGLKLVSTFY